MDSFSKQTAVVTGTTGGIGREIAIQLAQSGWNLIMVNRSHSKTQPLLDQLENEFPNTQVSLFACDLSKPDDIKSTAQVICEAHSEISALINNAGVLFNTGKFADNGNDLHFQVNVMAAYQLMDALKVPLEKAAATHGHATIVNVSSNAIFMSKPLEVDTLKKPLKQGIFSSYANSKLALTVLSGQLAKDLNSYGIKVYAIDPGGNRTQMTSGKAAPFFVRWFQGLLPLPSKGAGFILAPLLDPDFQANSGDLISSGKIKPIPRKSNTAEKINQLVALIEAEQA